MYQKIPSSNYFEELSVTVSYYASASLLCI